MNTNTIYITKIKSSELNGLEIDTNIDHIIISKLKYDSDIQIPPFLKTIHIKTLKEDNEIFNTILTTKSLKKNEIILIPSYDARFEKFDTLIECSKIPCDCKILFGGLTSDNKIYSN